MTRRRLDSPLPTSKLMSPTDFDQLSHCTAVLDPIPDLLAGQHPIRRWEYAMALYAIGQWGIPTSLEQPFRFADALTLHDVGGAGSNWWQALATLTPHPVVLVDPSIPTPDGQPGIVHHATRIEVAGTVEQYAAGAPHDQADVLTAISVLEHVPTPHIRPFLRACRMLLKPGGLLVLTMDCWDAEGEDTAHFHWMRERIYNVGLLRKLRSDLRELGFTAYGETDWSYHGHQVYDYSIASLTVIKA